MKKHFAFFCAAVVLAGAAFGQATINGYVRAIGTLTDEGNFNYVDRLRLNLKWTADNLEFASRFQLSSKELTVNTSDKITDVDVVYAYGKINLFGGKVAVTGGKLYNYDYDISSGYSDYVLGNVYNATSDYTAGKQGMLLQILPVEGLNIGVVALPGNTKVGTENFGVFGKYSISKVGDIVVHSYFADKDNLKDSNVSASFTLTAVEGLSASAGYKGLTKHAVYGVIDYSKDAFGIQVAPEYNVTDNKFYIEGAVKYTIADVTLMGLVGYDKDHVYLSGDYLVGAELQYKVGNGLVAFNPTYTQDEGFSLPIVVKVSF